MSDHFNGLTPVQAELLALLSDECGELVQIIGKIMRHGLDSARVCFTGNPNRAAMALNRERHASSAGEKP